MVFFIPARPRRENVRKVPARAIALLAAGLCVGCAHGDAPGGDSVLKSAMKTAGVATDAPVPKDFVANSRPPASADYVPIFRPPFTHAKKAKSPEELKAAEADSAALQARHDALRSAFPPAAQALAERKAAEAAKAKAPKKKKVLPTDTPPTP